MSAQLTLPTVLDDFRFRNIGPTRGGRVVAVAGDPRDPAVYYFGAVAGGVWKTEDAGTTWRCISDGFFKTGSVGALCVPDTAPNIIYAGMGETTIRTDVSHGDGVYKSTDGGRTWQHLGLADTRHIGRVRVHPRNPDIVYVAALGHAFGTNDDRGVFRSRNGGVTWEKVLFKSDRAGAVDLSLDEQNPDILYASIWQTYRNFWELSSGGPDSGLWRSLDGGDTWEEISLNQGFPQSLKGKIGVAASPVKAKISHSSPTPPARMAASSAYWRCRGDSRSSAPRSAAAGLAAGPLIVRLPAGSRTHGCSGPAAGCGARPRRRRPARRPGGRGRRGGRTPARPAPSPPG